MTSSDAPDIESLIKHFDIPPCPAVISALKAELSKESANASVVARLISHDVGLSGAVMRIVKSPAFRTGREVGSIDEALQVLGFGRVFDLVVGQLLKQSLGADSGIRLDRFWDSAACTADLCSTLAGRLSGTKRETAYCFGLFHDCGIPLLMRRFADYRQTLIVANRESGQALLAVEEARYGTNHALVGYLLARTWNLSETLCEAIRAHHSYDVLDPGMQTGLSDEVCALIAICTLAEHVAGIHLRNSEEGHWPAAHSRIRAFFGLGDREIEDLVEDLLLDLQAASTA